jgi:DNA end-binding protein Ku
MEMQTTFVDHHETALVDLLKNKQAGMPQKRELDRPRPKNVINLMDALERSIAAEATTEKKPPATSQRQRAGKTAGRPGRGHEARVRRARD